VWGRGYIVREAGTAAQTAGRAEAAMVQQRAATAA
jgi:hypothetical protein